MQEPSSTSNFKYLLQGAFVVAVSLLLFVLAGDAYEKAAKRNQINAFTKQRFEEYYALEKNTVDLLFIGSSHSYCTFDPQLIDPVLGTYSWQLGTPSQHADTSYYVLQNALETQSPHTVVMELYWDVLDDDFERSQADSFFEVCNNDALVNDYIQTVFPANERLKYELPAIRYQQSYFSYRSSRMKRSIEETYHVSPPETAAANGVEYYQAQGYVYCDIILPQDEYDRTNQFKGFDGKDWQMSDVQREYLDKIVSLCEEKGIRLIFVTAPIAPVSMDFIENYDLVHQALSDYAASKDVPYLDYNQINLDTPFLTNENFRDDAHLNHSGVTKVDAHFSTFLQSQN